MRYSSMLTRIFIVMIVFVTMFVGTPAQNAQVQTSESGQETRQLHRPKKFKGLIKYVKKTFANKFEIESLQETLAEGKPAVTFSFSEDGKSTYCLLIDNADSLTLHTDTYSQDASEHDSDSEVPERRVALMQDSCGGVSSPGNPYQCCSYGNCTWAAWYHAQRFWGVNLPGGWGNAGMWASSATSAGMTVLPSESPALYSIAVSSTLSIPGHVAMPIEISNNMVRVLEQGCTDTAGGIKFKWYWITSFNRGFILTNTSAPAPTMNWHSPSFLTSGPHNQAVTFNVSNVNPGCRIVVTFPNGGRATLKDGQLQLGSGTLTAQMTLGAPGWWKAQVYNENGKFSSAYNFFVN